jgi:hypothetical protein
MSSLDVETVSVPGVGNPVVTVNLDSLLGRERCFYQVEPLLPAVVLAADNVF